MACVFCIKSIKKETRRENVFTRGAAGLRPAVYTDKDGPGESSLRNFLCYFQHFIRENLIRGGRS